MSDRTPDYRSMAKSARSEGFDEIAEHFESFGKAVEPSPLMTDRYDAGFQAGYEAARKQAVDACREQREAFGSRGYRTGNPINSIAEQHGCSECLRVIAYMRPEQNDE